MMELTLRPMIQAEQAYCYTQSQQICMQTGLIGHLRADFGSNGTGFYSTFFDFRDSLKSDDFKERILYSCFFLKVGFSW